MQPSRDLSRLIEIMSALRDPKTGCPWDLEQDFSTLRHYAIEEAYEVADAIEREDFDDLRDELGDLLLQPVFHAQLAREHGLFEIGDVIYAITEKLIRRHPHVFGPDTAKDGDAAKIRWDAVKAQERAAKAELRAAKAESRTKAATRGAEALPQSVLDDVPLGMPALVRAEKLARRAAEIGFDWPDVPAVLAKVTEERAELEQAIADGDKAAMHEELGDLLFSIANLSRHLKLDAEAALRDANLKFTRRFHHVEARARADGIAPGNAGLERLDRYWNEIRRTDKLASGDG